VRRHHTLAWGILLISLALVLATGCNGRANPTSALAGGTEPGPTAGALSQSAGTASPTATAAPDGPDTSATPAAPSPEPATATPSTTPTPSPTPTPTRTPTATPTPTPVLYQLTTGGCCTQPFWSPDGQQILFIDKPAPDAPTGIWGVALDAPQTEPELYTERIALYTSDMAYVVEPAGNTTYIERLTGPTAGTDDARWSVPAGGRPVSISPGRTRIAWDVSPDVPAERRVTQVWIANLDGSEAQQIATLPRGGFNGWLSDDVVLLSTRESLQTQETVVYTYSLIDGQSVELIRTERPRGMAFSSDGRWLAYYISLSDNLEENGLWLVRSDGSERIKLEPALFGAYEWRDAHHLVILPFQPDAAYHEVWEYDVDTGDARRLTDPNVTPIKIANGDWQLSPDGRRIAFVESRDYNIWVLELPDWTPEGE
jgi:Tol biopolymer transport system component